MKGFMCRRAYTKFRSQPAGGSLEERLIGMIWFDTTASPDCELQRFMVIFQFQYL